MSNDKSYTPQRELRDLADHFQSRQYTAMRCLYFADHIDELERARDKWKLKHWELSAVKCAHPNVTQCAKEWQANQNRAQLESVDPKLAEEFPFGCDTMEAVAEALVAARAQLASTRALLQTVTDAWDIGAIAYNAGPCWHDATLSRAWRDAARKVLDGKDGVA